MDPLGRNMHLIVWEKTKGKPDAQGLMRFSAGAKAPHDAFLNLANLLDSSTVWRVDAKDAVSRSILDRKETPGQLCRDDRFIRGFFVVKGSMKDAIKLTHEIDLSFIGKLPADLRKSDALAASAPQITVAPLVGLEGAMIVMWMPILSPKAVSHIPVDFMLDLIRSLDRWARQLQEKEVLLDTGRLTLTFGTSHTENGKTSPGRKTGGRLIAVGTYDTAGRTLEDAVAGSGFSTANSVIEEARPTILGCAQGYDKCQGNALSSRPPVYDDGRESMLG
ncbi:MAG: hypothetical protein R2729_13040 [Bryobacteraceae bacterium]